MTFRIRFQYLYDRASEIAHAARLLNPKASRLPPLFFFTDPVRTPHPEDVATLLPTGAGIVYRHFGDSHAPGRARLLRRIADDHGLILLIGEDDVLARDVGADGVHLAERNLGRATGLRTAHPELRLTAACHSLAVARKLPDILDGAFVSPVFASRSPSAADITPLGARGAYDMAEAAPVPVHGLGGITCDNIALLRDSGLAGVAAVDAFNLD